MSAIVGLGPWISGLIHIEIELTLIDAIMDRFNKVLCSFFSMFPASNKWSTESNVRLYHYMCFYLYLNWISDSINQFQ